MSRNLSLASTSEQPYNFSIMIPPTSTHSAWQKISTFLLIIVALGLFSLWLIFTPPGIDGKIHAAGYAVCHQLESHTLSVGGKLLPLCARCTGTFIGLLLSLIYLSPNKKYSGFPSKLKTVILYIFFAAFLIDGINSSLTLLPGVTPFYTPNNDLRLFTGLLFGIALANLVVPLWNQTLWVISDPKPVLHSWKQFILLILLCVSAGVLILLNIPFLYYPIAILSTLSIFLILGMIYSLLWCIILKKENSLHQFMDGIRIFCVGMITAILQVGMLDLIRYMLTKTW